MNWRKFLSSFFRSVRTHQQDDEHSARTRLELALESSGLVDWDFDYIRNTAHRSLRHDQLYGYKEMLPKWNFEDFFHHVLPEYHELATKSFEDIPRTGRIEFDFKIRRVDGEIRWIHLVGKAKKDKKGTLLRVVGILKDITEEKNAEEELKLQTSNLYSLFESSPEFFCLISGEGLIYEYVNPAHIELFNGKDMRGLSVIEAQPELAGTDFVSTLKNILKNGNTVIYKDAPAQIGPRLRYIDMIYTPRRNAEGEFIGIYALGSDVTAKVEALKKAEASEEKIKLITDKLPAFISYTDNEGRYQFMNAMYEKWFDRPISEMLGKTRKELTPEEYAIQSKPYESKALHGNSSHHEGIIKKANGQFMNLDINFVPDVDPETKKVRGMIAVGVDMTKQVQLLQEAELARKELHEVFMQAPAPMCLLSGPDYVFTMANPLYVDLVKREVLGKKLVEVFEGEDIDHYRAIIDKVYFEGKSHYLMEAPLDLYDDKGEMIHRYVNVGYHPYKDLHGKVKGVLVIVLDVTAQVNSVKTRDNFMGIASHELKTPLTALKLQTQMQQKMLELHGTEFFDASKLQKFFNTTNNQLNRLVRLVDDMLDVSRIAAERLNMNFATVNFSKLVDETFENFQPQFDSVNSKLELDLQKDIHLYMDESRMEQVLMNLITNVIKYAPEKPVRVTLTSDGKHATLKVQDHGKGIDPTYLDKIFERFERMNTGRDISGLGIGLYISKKIVLSHQGKIWAESSPGSGTTFVVELPV